MPPKLSMVRLMSFDDWVEEFQPIANIFNRDAPYDGCMFETYGIEHEKVLEVIKEHPGKVWTLLEDDEGNPMIGDGYHHVNRIGYFITAKPSDMDLQYEIKDD